MKRYTIGLITLLLIVGCSKEPINYETTLVNREGVFYTNDTNKPYSGPVFSLNDDGKKKDELILKDGKMIRETNWSYYSNGQKNREETFKDGKKDGLWTYWHKNGQKNREETFKDGKGIFRILYLNGHKLSELNFKEGKQTDWNESGQKIAEFYFKDGKADGLSTYWHENGQKFHESTFKNGKQDGLLTMWYDNGQKWEEGTWKGGKPISSKYWNEDGSVKND